MDALITRPTRWKVAVKTQGREQLQTQGSNKNFANTGMVDVGTRMKTAVVNSGKGPVENTGKHREGSSGNKGKKVV